MIPKGTTVLLRWRLSKLIPVLHARYGMKLEKHGEVRYVTLELESNLSATVNFGFAGRTPSEASLEVQDEIDV